MSRRSERTRRTLTSGPCTFTPPENRPSHDKAVAQSKAPFLRAMGTHRTYEHLQECYMVGGIDRINDRIEDLRKSGLQYLVLGPVSDDPKQIDLMAKKVVKAFR